jgi:hypothetical protein
MPEAPLLVSAHADTDDVPQAVQDFANRLDAAPPITVEVGGGSETDQTSFRAAVDALIDSVPPPDGYTAAFAGYHVFHGPRPDQWEWVNSGTGAVIKLEGPEPGYVAVRIDEGQ